jgi:hypothetical protein
MYVITKALMFGHDFGQRAENRCVRVSRVLAEARASGLLEKLRALLEIVPEHPGPGYYLLLYLTFITYELYITY